MNKYSRILVLICCLFWALSSLAQPTVKLRKKDRRKDIELVTTSGNLVLRLYDETPVHRDNFLRLVKSGYYDSVLFHRVIRQFMIQSGDPDSRHALPHQPLGNGGPDYTLPAEFRPDLFHRKGVLAAAREGDQVNPEKRSSASQFYIVQGRTFTDRELDSVEVVRLHGYKLPPDHRQVYKTIGGTPQLDQNYTVFGYLVKGTEVLDRIAGTATSKEQDHDRPLEDVRILKARLVRRKG